ncbi:MAG: FtsX-like permease family protein, partial [Vicinamibacterales bacterium]
YVGPDYLQVFGLSPVAGRTLELADRTRTARSALISRNLAEALWGGQSPIGRTLTVDQHEVEVVGVTPNAYFSGFRREQRDFIFPSAEQEPAAPGETTLYLRHTGRSDLIGPAIRAQLQRTDPRTAVVNIRSWEAQLTSATWPVRVLTMLLMLFAGGSLFIAAVGQYAVVAFDMRRRVRELGLRIALGASSRQVLVKVLQEGVSLTAIGLALGFALSLVTAQVLKRALYGVTPTDPLTYTGVFALLAIASLLACYLPARRASQINPITALRYE